MTVYYYYPSLWELFKYILVILLYVLAGLGYVLMCQVKYEKNVALKMLWYRWARTQNEIKFEESKD